MRNGKLRYLKSGSIIVAVILLLGGSFFAIQGPSIIKNIAKTSLERKLAPIGVTEIEIGKISVGWGRFYLRDISSKSTPSTPTVHIQEMDIALSLFFKVKAIDVIGATLELNSANKVSFVKEDFQKIATHLGNMITRVKPIELPAIALRDCLLIIPSSKGDLKLPLHATTETTVSRNHILTVDWGTYEKDQFAGQLVLESSRKGISFDFHMTNTDIQLPIFHIQAPEISLWGTTINDLADSYKIDGFAKIERLTLGQYGSLKRPLEVNIEGEGTVEDFAIDEMSIMTLGKEKNYIELEGSFRPKEVSGQLILTSEISQLSDLWDFTPLFVSDAETKVSIGGKLKLTSEVRWDKGNVKTSALAFDIKGGSFVRDGLSVVGINTQFVFNTLFPLTTNNFQTVSAKLINLSGIDLRNISFQCQFDNAGAFQVKEFLADTLSGKLIANRFQKTMEGPQSRYLFAANFQNIELSDILKLTDLKALSGKAKLSGNASMSYSVEDGIDIIKGELRSISNPGHIQYRPEKGMMSDDNNEQKNVNLAFQVLDNLYFSTLSVLVERDQAHPADMKGTVKILGSNPSVLNGYPFEFNIVTSGKLKDLVLNTFKHMGPRGNLGEIKEAIELAKQAKAVTQASRAGEDASLEQAKSIGAEKAPVEVQKGKKKKKTKSKKKTKGNRKITTQLKNRKLSDG